MKVVEQSFEEFDLDNLFLKVERCGRVCYKSENLITEDSGISFVQRLLANKHGAVLEHFVFVYEVPMNLYERIEAKHYKFFNLSNISKPIVSFNLRTIMDHYKDNPHKSVLAPLFSVIKKEYPILIDALYGNVETEGINKISKEELHFLTSDEKDIHQYITIKVTTDRGVSHELVRHRLCSFAQESTRYCNYGKDKFGNEITVIKPTAISDQEYDIWEEAMLEVEKCYFQILRLSSSPQLARSVLPNSLKTELVITANIKEWKLIFELRTAKAAHPDVQVLMKKVQSYFIEKSYL